MFKTKRAFQICFYANDFVYVIYSVQGCLTAVA